MLPVLEGEMTIVDGGIPVVYDLLDCNLVESLGRRIGGMDPQVQVDRLGRLMPDCVRGSGFRRIAAWCSDS